MRYALVSVDHNCSSMLTLPIPRILSSKAQKLKDFLNLSKPCHVGIHWKALAEYSQMSTMCQGFSSFSGFFNHFVLAKLSTQQHEGLHFPIKGLYVCNTVNWEKEHFSIRMIEQVIDEALNRLRPRADTK